MASDILTPERSTRSVETPPPSISTSILHEDESFLPTTRLPLSHPKPSYLPWQASSTRSVVAILFAVVFTLSFGAGLTVVPLTRIHENIMCHYIYDGLKGAEHIGFDEEIPEEMCKGEKVQEQLNLLLATLGTVSCIPSLATTVAYGTLADRIGRRPVFALAITGVVLAAVFNLTITLCWQYVSLRWIWLSPMFLLIGGGEVVINMMFFAIANDVTKETTRSIVFLWGGAGGLFAQITAPSIASFLMLRSPWLPIAIGMVLLIIGTCLIAFLPETLGMKPTKNSDEISDISEAPKVDDTSSYTILRSKITNLFASIHESTKIFHSLPILLLLITFLVGPFGRVAGDMALRYVSNRYGWKLREVGFLLSLQATINIVLIVIILPALSHYLLTQWSYTSKSKDLTLAKSSAVMLSLGALFLAMAPTIGLAIVGLTVWTLGTGFSAITRSLITALVDQHHVGRLFAAIAVIELLCYMAATQMQAGLYHLGLKWKGGWQGLPYYSLALMYAFAGVAVFAFGWVMRREMSEGAIRLGDEDVERVDGEDE